MAALAVFTVPGIASAQKLPGWNDAGWKTGGNSRSRGSSGSYYSGRSQQSYGRQGDSVKICECCATITKELEAAEKKAEALKEPLKIEPPLSPSKVKHGKK